MKRLTLLFLIIGLNIIFTPIIGAQTSSYGLYKVGIGDIINIEVLGHNDLQVLSSVAVDGTIAFPHLGNVYVKDKTLSEIKEQITKKLGDGYIKYPVVLVSLMKAESKKVFIHGEVRRIGAIPFEKDMTVVKAVSIAGGISEGGLYGKIKIRRKHEGELGGYKDIVEEEINNGIIMNKKIEDMVLQSDDILIVERDESFLIQGEVAKRGRFVLEKDMTVLRALLEAGGVSLDGLYGKIKIRRKHKEEPGGYKDITESKLNDGVIESSEVENTVLQPDDILIVERSDTFLIQGEVGRRGKFVLEKDMTVLRALLEAGGVSPDGRYGKIKLRRKAEGEQGVYKDIVESTINDGVIESSKVEDMIIQPDDILIIEQNKTYFIYGEANNTGEFILKHNMTVFKALTIARGFTKWGSENRVKILRLIGNGEGFSTIKVNIDDVLDGDASADILLQPGDTVVVSSGIF
jgi:polysaccharide export outer membrane protein